MNTQIKEDDEILDIDTLWILTKVQTIRKWLKEMKKDKYFKDRRAKARRHIFKQIIKG